MEGASVQRSRSSYRRSLPFDETISVIGRSSCSHHQVLGMGLGSLLRKPGPSSFPRRNTTYHNQNRSKTHETPNPLRCSSQEVPLNPPPPQNPAAKTESTSSDRPTNNFYQPLPPANFTTHSLSYFSSGKKSSRFVCKLRHSGPKPKPWASSRHTFAAEEALQCVIELPSDTSELENLFVSYKPRLNGWDDFNYLVRELGQKGEFSKAMRWYRFAVHLERKPFERNKLATSMISILGRFGKIELARNVFDVAVREGFGNTAYTYSAMINAYGRSGYCNEAVGVFRKMKAKGLKPNLVTYNHVIDACYKGGVKLKSVLDVFNDMLANEVAPNAITFGSLLAVCSRDGLWEHAMKFFSEMVSRGIDPNIITYSTLLDAVCKGGKMDLAVRIMSEMVAKDLMPNVVTYNTVIDGFAKAGKLDDALDLYNKMKLHGVPMDKVSYSILVSIYAKLGKLKEALNVCEEMEPEGIRKNVVIYNQLLGGFGKQGNYDQVKLLINQMKSHGVMPNTLTYSILIDVYSKGGLYQEAMQTFQEFKLTDLKASVVLYSALIDAHCKNGPVASAVSVLDEMTREGIKPNVVTYSIIIDALGRSAAGEAPAGAAAGEAPAGAPKVSDVNGQNPKDVANNGVFQKLVQLVDDRSSSTKKFKYTKQEFLYIVGIFHKMHELEIKPDVVVFSAVLNACNYCTSFEDASMLLEELCLFDDRVYGIALGLLTGYREQIWPRVLSLFDEVNYMDFSTVVTFYNALTDVLWHFGQRYGAQLVVLEGRKRNLWEKAWSESCLDLHLMSIGAARAMVHAWFLNLHCIVSKGHKLQKDLSIVTGLGKHSKVVGDGVLRKDIEGLLTDLGVPFYVEKPELGSFTLMGTLVATWLKDSSTLKLLILEDQRTLLLPPENTKLGHK